MSRVSGFLLITVVVIAVLTTTVNNPVEGQFATNTPIPTSLMLYTNTPAGPTSTPTMTPTNTVTPSPTPTATLTPTPTFTPSNTPTPTPTPIGPFFYPEGINPLTGIPYPSDEAMARRNLIVKISNYPPLVRPQHGVNAADVVYEYEAEGGVTRFAAIFRSNAPAHVGSIRSARLLDTELLVMYQALLAYSGTSDPIQNIILSSDWVYQTFSPLKGDNCQDTGFCRFQQDGLALEHTMFLDTTKLYQKATDRNVNTGYKAFGFAFNEKPDPEGSDANDIFINWWGQTDARWQFDSTTGRYLRYTDGLAHYDAADEQQLWTDNLVIIEVPHNERPDLFPAGATYESLEIALWDQGFAYVIRDGKAYRGYWRRRSQNAGDALQLIYGDNTPIMLKPGRTWVTVVRGLGTAIISGDLANMPATATAIELNTTPTATSTPQDDSD